jgi:hypothetical protein
MSSSISSSRVLRALTVFLPVLAVMLAAEAGVRLFVRYRGEDMRHIAAIPRIAERLGRADGLRILFLGNSLTRSDLDLDVIRQRLTGPVASERVYPDDTKIGEWYYAFKHYFVDSGRLPNLLVLGFVGRQVEDYGELEPSRMASAYGGLSNMNELFQRDITDFGSRAEFLLASVSTAFANRERVKNRVLDAVIPSYDSAATRMNHAMRDRIARAEAPRTYRRLERLLDLAGEHRVHVVLVSMPQPDNYPVDDELLQRLRVRSATYLDCRQVAGITAGHFPDGYHLGPAGARVFSLVLGSQLSGVVRDVAGRTSVQTARRQTP